MTKDETRIVTCTWAAESGCVDCELQGKLNCRWDSKLLKFFLWNQAPSLVMAFLGLTLIGVLTRTWWPLIVYGAACVLLWVLGVETRLLCTHCPFYAEDSKTLHCYALHGSPKIWRYRPGPMNRVEKAMLLFCFGFLLLFPVAVEAWGIWFIAVSLANFGLVALLGVIGVTLATLMAEMQFIYILSENYCTRCVNFSCPGNRVPKYIVDAYLKRNPVMKEAWQKSGYELS